MEFQAELTHALERVPSDLSCLPSTSCGWSSGWPWFATCQSRFSAAFLLLWQTQGLVRHWLMRAKDNLCHEVLATHAPGDFTIRMPISPLDDPQRYPAQARRAEQAGLRLADQVSAQMLLRLTTVV